MKGSMMFDFVWDAHRGCKEEGSVKQMKEGHEEETEHVEGKGYLCFSV